MIIVDYARNYVAFLRTIFGNFMNLIFLKIDKKKKKKYAVNAYVYKIALSATKKIIDFA